MDGKPKAKMGTVYQLFVKSKDIHSRRKKVRFVDIMFNVF
jgi:hypothetical protein